MFHTSVVKTKHLEVKYSVANSCNDLASRSLQVKRKAKRSSEPSLQAMLEISSSGSLTKALPPFAFFLVVVSPDTIAAGVDTDAVGDILLELLASDAMVGGCGTVVASKVAIVYAAVVTLTASNAGVELVFRDVCSFPRGGQGLRCCVLGRRLERGAEEERQKLLRVAPAETRRG